MKYWFAAFMLVVGLCVPASPQTGTDSSSQTPAGAATVNTAEKTAHDDALEPGDDPDNRLVLPFIKHLAGDQKEFWTAPTRFQKKDLKWIAPFAAGTAAFIASDSWFARQVNPRHMQTSLHISEYGTYSFLGLSGASYLLGTVSHDDHLQEAGLLSGEAAINSAGVTYLLKGISQRQRPLDGNGHGSFFQGGASFPSEHSAVAWSIASVWAHEYPGWLSQATAYGLASAVTVTRVTSQQHFPADVLIGSVLGWYFGMQTYRSHHDAELGGSGWGNPLPDDTSDEPKNPDNMASPYVLVDSWIYPLLDRLAAMGYVQSAYLGNRPWSRMECARLVQEAQDKLSNDNADQGEAVGIYDELAHEFADEIARLDGAPNVGAKVESIYTRTTQISGTPLRDSFHFGQTIINDNGRPYWRGFNNVSGFTTWSVAGPFALYVNGEYQHSPAVPSESGQTRQLAAIADTVPVINPNPIAQIDRLRLLTATASLQVANVQISVGQQSLWLGPSAAGSFLFTNNSEPMPMLRIDTVAPYRIPLLSDLLGPMRNQFFLGRLSGQLWSLNIGPGLTSQPWVQGSKVSFKPTENLELGFGYTAQFGGTGNPFTWGNFIKTFYAHKASTIDNPAKRLSQFDFSYRVPGLRNWLTLYMDSLVIDEYSPIGSSRPQINPGIYLPQLPKLHKMQLRFEGVTTDLNIPSHFGAGAVYTDVRYLSGYTNNGNLIGNWIGRRGRGEQGWATYSFSPRSQIQFGYRHNNVDKTFLEGGTLQDFNLEADIKVRQDLSISANVQRETWNFPALSATGQTDVLGSVELTFFPNWDKKRR